MVRQAEIHHLVGVMDRELIYDDIINHGNKYGFTTLRHQYVCWLWEYDSPGWYLDLETKQIYIYIQDLTICTWINITSFIAQISSMNLIDTDEFCSQWDIKNGMLVLDLE